MTPQLLQLDDFILSIRLKAALAVQPVARATAITKLRVAPKPLLHGCAHGSSGWMRI